MLSLQVVYTVCQGSVKCEPPGLVRLTTPGLGQQHTTPALGGVL